MTTNTTAENNAPRTGQDPRPAFTAAMRTAVAVAGAVRPDQLDGPTPCPEFDVRTLLGHLVMVLRRVAAVGRGEPALSVTQVGGVPDDGWGNAARAAADEVGAAWADDEVLVRELSLPFGRFPGAAALAVYTGELTTHTWDLAVATGQSPDWEPQAVAVGLAAVRRALPEDRRGPEVPFGPVVPVAGDAPAIEQLVGWQGRDPAWRP